MTPQQQADRDRETVKNWPQDLPTFRRVQAKAKDTYAPLVNKLTAPEVYGLFDAVSERLEYLNSLVKTDPGSKTGR